MRRLSTITVDAWYDQTAGNLDWVMIANPSASPMYYGIDIAGVKVKDDSGVPIPAGGNITPTFPGQQNGPVEVTSTGGSVMASQRVLWNGYFNEVLGQ